MATVVQVGEDTRYSDIGQGLGALARYFHERKKKDELDRKAEDIARQIAIAPDYDSAVTILNTTDPKVLEMHGDRLRQGVQDKYRKQSIVTGYDPSGAQKGVVVKEFDDIQKQLDAAGVGLKGPSPAWGVEIDGNMDTAPDEVTADLRVQDALKRGGKGRKIAPPQVESELTLYKIEQDAITDRIKARQSSANKTQDWEAIWRARFITESSNDTLITPEGTKTLIDTESNIDSNFKTVYGTLGAGGVMFQSPGKGRMYETAKGVTSKIIGRGGSMPLALKAGKIAGDLEIVGSMLDGQAEEVTGLATDKVVIDQAFLRDFNMNSSKLYELKMKVEGANFPEYIPSKPETIHEYPLTSGARLQFIIVDGKFIPLQRVK